MKRLIALLLALALPCCAVAQTADVTGDWYLTALRVGEDALDPATLGMSLWFSLYEDGTAWLSMPGTLEADGTWTLLDGRLTVDAQGALPIELAVGEGELVTQRDGMDLVFTQQAPAFMAYREAQADAQAAPEDYQGCWQAALVVFGGMQMPADAAGMQQTLTVEGQQLLASGKLLNGQAACQVQDGLLTADLQGTTVTLQLLTDGRAAYHIDEVSVLYFEKEME